MAAFKWLQLIFYAIQVLQSTAITTYQLSLIIRDRHDATLPCKNVMNDHHGCVSTTWSFTQAKSGAVDIVKSGRILVNTRAKPDRLSVTVNCSLVIKNVSKEDAGRYFCIQEGPEQRKEREAVVDMSVVTMTQKTDNGRVMLECRVWARTVCEHTVKWLFGGQDVDKDNRELNPSGSCSSAIITFQTSHYILKSEGYELLKCEVKEKSSGKSHNFIFSRPSSRRQETAFGNFETTTTRPEDWWWIYVIGVVGLAALLITAVAMIRWRRNTGCKKQTDLNMTDPEDVSYVTISHTNKTKSNTKVRGGDHTVTYSTVKASLDDPSNLYAMIK